MISKKQIALLHFGLSRLWWDETRKRDLLRGVGCASESSKDLTSEQLDQALKRMMEAGFRPKLKGGRKSRAGREPLEKERSMDKIAALLSDMKLSWNYAKAIAKRQTGMERLEWLDKYQLHKVLIALEYKKKKREAQYADAQAR